MQLVKIKLAGFKSFVDPTTIVLPSNLVAVVGPNGCGKSNIIDAITWVMGESSPKYLRGETIADVIFNGSNSRKPIGQATVELIFDNSSGTLGKEYSNFGEISIKRLINRDGDTGYYLNNTRCRKRDIIDIFLGTGLGPRSYSIIGQNMISRIIEAKPEELRTYLEEASGISKYKEKRHETELRMRATRENIQRLDDIYGQLILQLEHLHKQAQTAEKYANLRAKERNLKSELLALQWREFNLAIASQAAKITDCEFKIAERHTVALKIDEELAFKQTSAHQLKTTLDDVQRTYYSVKNEISRLEQDAKFKQEKITRLNNELLLTEHKENSATEQLNATITNQANLQAELTNLDPEYQVNNEQLQTLEQDLAHHEQSVLNLDTQWEALTTKINKQQLNIQVQKAKLNHINHNITTETQRQQQVNTKLTNLNASQLPDTIEKLVQQLNVVESEYVAITQHLESARVAYTNAQQEKTELSQQLNALQEKIHTVRAQHTATLAIQQSALGKDTLNQELKKFSWANYPRLAEQIQVAPGWEFAVEKVLSFDLQAICINDFAEIDENISELTTNSLGFITHQTVRPLTSHDSRLPSLLSKITTALALDTMLIGIYVAENYTQALQLRASLEPGESIITRDGVWVGNAWLKILRSEDLAHGILQREQELVELSKTLAELEHAKTDLQRKISTNDTQIASLRIAYETLQQNHSQAKAKILELRAQHAAKSEQAVYLRTEITELETSLNNCKLTLTKLDQELAEQKPSLTTATDQLINLEDEQKKFALTRNNARELLKNLHYKVNFAKDNVHKLLLRLQTIKTQASNMDVQLTELDRLQVELVHTKIQLTAELQQTTATVQNNDALTAILEQHVILENELNSLRDSNNECDNIIKQLTTQHKTEDRAIADLKDELAKLRIDLQAFNTKLEGIVEQAAASDANLAELSQTLAPETDPNEWRAQIDTLAMRIGRLGAINLAAIDEYNECNTRKEYLDSQLADLNLSLQTLEEAIAKIDNETRQVFKQTFEQVNLNFQHLFPDIFSGGKAYLSLTDNNLLTAGVNVMASPPGKRISSVYLLSGGEKSLTALALIFSIFNLNPAPFCLLDEVDAALDDTNVGRFVQLVKLMADKTQFIFISHNKNTIALGEHLIGVTMKEPGVSRLVTVDIQQALKLVEPA